MPTGLLRLTGGPGVRGGTGVRGGLLGVRGRLVRVRARRVGMRRGYLLGRLREGGRGAVRRWSALGRDAVGRGALRRDAVSRGPRRRDAVGRGPLGSRGYRGAVARSRAGRRGGSGRRGAVARRRARQGVPRPSVRWPGCSGSTVPWAGVARGCWTGGAGAQGPGSP
ncbi:hypothetical protein DUI70_2131 [Streptomyces albus]|nr:hypothetical protein DUI70_2131 [Streptomyces albus]